MFSDITQFHSWFARRRSENDFLIDAVPLDEMDAWRTDPDTGVISHESGRFFSVRGIEVETDHREKSSWAQPIIVQPEIGILGILVTIIDGEAHCLLQAKMEPGNINVLQLSPTVQATRSNYTRVHRGKSVPYLEHFVFPRAGRTAFDSLQSEQGSWFVDKRNRNMIVEVAPDIPVLEDFCWLRLDQVAALLKVPNRVNMDARTVLSGLPFLRHTSDPLLGPSAGLGNDSPEALHDLDHLLSWFTEAKSRYRLARRYVPLTKMSDWVRVDGRIRHVEGKFFSIIGVNVQASNREVGRWSQPMLEPAGQGTIAFLGRHIRDTFHVLVHARTEAGTHDVVEMSPTVACLPGNYDGAGHRPVYLDLVEQAPASKLLVDVVQSEEGGRFYRSENRYLLIDAGDALSLEVPEDYCWMTIAQLTEFVRYGNYVNVAARCLLSCLDEAAIAGRTPVNA